MVDAAAVVVVALVVVVVALVVVEPVVEDFWGIFLLFLTQAAAEDIPLSFGAGAALFLFLLDFSRRSLRELFILEEGRGDGAVRVVVVICDGAEKICLRKEKAYMYREKAAKISFGKQNI